ncbi:hypothetical protein BC830DRAFT_1115825 [Chytriomyces sp. MP71]|nr:hypothetical protein BC830DRAFT_1115825 [Chytriomyces sp. MP71]
MDEYFETLLAQEQVISHYAAVISGVSFLTIPALIYLIQTHLASQGKPFSLKTLLTPFNATLLGLAISFTGLCAADSYAVSSGFNPQVRANCGAVQAVFACSYHTCYIIYSYNRGIAIIKLHLPKLKRFMKFLLYIIPCIFYTSLVPQITATVLAEVQPSTSPELLNLLGNVAQAVNAAGSISAAMFDGILLASFFKGTIAFRQKNGLNVDEMRLVIISKYGTSAIVVYFISNGFFVASFSVPHGVFADELMQVAQTLLFFVYLILVGMKVELQRNSDNSSSVGPGYAPKNSVPSITNKKTSNVSAAMEDSATCQKMV